MNFDKRIVLVTPGFAADEDDSVCIPPLQAYVQALEQQYPQAEIIVVALHYPKRKDIYKWKNATIYSLHGERFSGVIKALYLIWKLQRLIKRLHRERPVDIIHSFWLNDTTFMAQRFSLKYHVRHIATIMGQDALPANRFLRLLHFRHLYVVAISQQAANAFHETTGKKADRILPWGLSRSDLSIEKDNEKTIDVLGVGSFIPLKNYTLFINLIEKLNNEGLMTKSVIAGQGSEEKKLRQLLKEKNMEQQVELVGEIPRPQVLRLMQQSKVFLHCSEYEGQGYVFLEALAAGLPVVCFNSGFLPKNKKVHVCSNEAEMLEALRQLLSKPQTYEPVAIPLIEETADAYWKIYF